MTEIEQRDIERKRIGKLIAELRAEKKLTQVQLSELSDVGHSHIARIETGRYSVGIDTLAKIAGALGVEIAFKEKTD